MKRQDNLIDKIVEYCNMEESFLCVVRENSNRRSINKLVRYKDCILSKLSEEIVSGTYRIGGYKEFEIFENGKKRLIQAMPFVDRIAVHAITTVLSNIFNRSFIRDTFSGIKGRGIHDGLNRLKKALSGDREGTKYCLKIDIKKFYNSVDQDVLIEMLGKKIKDKVLLYILRNIIRSYEKGLPIGFYSSQFFGNFYLSPLDFFVKYVLREKYYFRYCDDIVVLSDSKERLRFVLKEMRNIIENDLHLEVKYNYQIFPVESRGIDFLGYVTRHDYVLIRKRIKKKAARRLKSVSSRIRRQDILSAFYGWAKHANCNNLFLKLAGVRMEDFKDLGISYKPKNGKKMFDNKTYTLSDIQNLKISIYDFEVDIKTRYGEGRYVVLFELEGKKGKFITDSDEMKDILNQIRDAGKLPFNTVLKRSLLVIIRLNTYSHNEKSFWNERC